MSATKRDEQMLAACSNLTVARYFLHHADVPQVGSDSPVFRHHELLYVLWSNTVNMVTMIGRFVFLI